MFEGEDAKNAYLQLIFATEIYAQRYVYSSINSTSGKTWLEDFAAKMNSVAAAFNTMSDTDKATFDTELGALYTTYKSILDDYNSEDDGEVDLGDWADDFEELKEAVLNLELAYAIVSESGSYYDLFFTAYERVISIANRILADNTVPADIKRTFVYSELYSTSSLDKILDPDFVIDPEDEIFWSYDYVISVYRSMYVNALLSMADGSGLYDYYQQFGFTSFMDRIYDVIWAYMGAEKDATDMFEKDKVLEAMKSFAKMDPAAQIMFILYIEGEDGLYYSAISAFLKEEFSANVAAVGEILMGVEMDALIYNYYTVMLENDGATEEEVAEAAAAFVASYEEFETAVSELDEAEREAFNTAFAEIINVYKALAEKVASDSVEG
jgi:hypothetical protein